MLPAGSAARNINSGVILNLYPDSLALSLQGALDFLRHPLVRGAFSQFYLLPTFFNSDLDRGFSIIDYGLNSALVRAEDLDALAREGLSLKLDLVLNHLSVNSPQYRDLLENGSSSPYIDFFIDWDKFWQGKGERGPGGYLVPRGEYLAPLFMRKPGLPLIRADRGDGTTRFYWNTFYQETRYDEISPAEMARFVGLTPARAEFLRGMVKGALEKGEDLPFAKMNLEAGQKEKLKQLVRAGRRCLGQVDLNARSEKVWQFYEQTLARLKGYGTTLVRLDAFAYLHKQPGCSNFFNRPGTWHYLKRLKNIADPLGLALMPEIHAPYGSRLHEELSGQGYPVYDFFLPGLVIDALEHGDSETLLKWAREIWNKKLNVINMLGSHDGIPLLDLGGGENSLGVKGEGLLSKGRIEALVELVLSRGGRVKDLYGPDGNKISYYQVNATYFSALGESENKLLLARAVQLFMPGRPQVWYLDLFAGKNDYAALERAGAGGHKEINRTNLAGTRIEEGLSEEIVLNQLKLIRFRNSFPAFEGTFFTPEKNAPNLLSLCWEKGGYRTALEADLTGHTFKVEWSNPAGEKHTCRYP